MTVRDDQAPTRPLGPEGTTLTAPARSAPPDPVQVDALERYQRLDRYVVLEPLGKGGMGVVYGAYDPLLRRRVALKVIGGALPTQGAHAVDHEQGRGRMIREARAMARLSHPNVLPVYDVGICEGHVFIAMEQVSGQTLRQWLQRPRSAAAVLDVFCRAGEGLAAAHAEGLVHRDFKPDNVMIDEAGRVLVLDFGLVTPSTVSPRSSQLRELYELPVDEAVTQLTRAGHAMGTPAYMAPEQHDAKSLDRQVDQYAFCVALYEALVGHRPFTGQSLSQLMVAKSEGPAPAPRGSMSAAMERVLRRGMAPDPAERWSSLPELLAQLRRVPRVRRRRRVMVGAGLLGALVIAASWPRPGECRWARSLTLPTSAAAHLTEQAAAWRDEARQACRAEHDPQLAERTRWCLDEVRVELMAAARAPGAVELRPASVCQDAGALLAWTQPPPAESAEVLEVREALISARASATDRTPFDPLVTRARALGDLRLVAEIHLAQANVQREGAAAGFSATASAMDANDAEQEARGWLTALERMAADPARHAEVLGWHQVAQAVVERAGADARLVAWLALVFERPLRSSGRRGEAQKALERARRHPGVGTLSPALRQRLDDALTR